MAVSAPAFETDASSDGRSVVRRTAMTRATTSAFVFIPFVLALAAPAQQLVHRSFAPPVAMSETDVLTPTTPWPDPAPNAFTTKLAPLGGGPILGDLTMDNVLGLMWETDGFILQATNISRYAPLAPPVAPALSPAPGLTGIALDATAGILYATDGALLFTMTAAPPFAFLAPPAPFAFPAIAPPFTGLDYDPGSGLLYACDVGGYVYYFTTAGLPSGPNPVFVPPGPMPPATDLCARPSIFPGMFVQFLGLGVVDYTSGLLQPAPATGIPPGTEGGLAYHAHPAVLPGACPCAPGGPILLSGVNGPTVIPSPSFAFTLAFAPPSSTVLFGLDFGISPLPMGGGCTFYLPYPPAILAPVPTTPAGTATFPIAVPSLPFLFGLPVVTQWGAACAAAPSGFVVSDALRSILSTP
jgi:hypothetical protein